jgi:hypothetical protein
VNKKIKDIKKPAQINVQANLNEYGSYLLSRLEYQYHRP